ncbi:DUF4198 domain-containing protein [Henriciella aquimarina]|uniref:DUF4198 domain-containing protein n=1 Tax=Henriciella aquimarina TaxID=545261 RepID=UPI0009FCB488|nr:DUF4198 domain-containing protein [Henriciella aquimarina]
MTVLKTGATALAAALGLCASASAHTSYLLPNVFITSEGEYVTLEASFTEDPFVPEIAVRSDDYHVVLPDGTRDDFEAVTPFRQVVILEDSLEAEGTYRFTTGVRLGRTSKKALVDGEWEAVFGPDAEVPENATEVITSQTETVADVYVTKGASTWESVNKPLGRLVFKPITHPSEIYLGDGFEFQVLFDGEPLAGQSIEVKRAGGAYESPKYERHVETGADGKLALSFDAPGKYLIMTRHAADAPEGADTDERSYTTSLTFEVAR